MVILALIGLNVSSCQTTSDELKTDKTDKMESSIKEIVGHAYGHNEQSGAKKKILMIASNPAVSKQTGWPIGCWAAELTHPYKEFTEAGFEVVIASPQGGKIEFDAYSDPRDESKWSAGDLISMGFINTPELMQQTETTVKLSEVNPDDFQAVFLVGGQAPMYTFKGNQELMDFFANFYETGKPSAAVCHSTTILTDTKLSNGDLLVKGKTWTGFANSEEDIADQALGQKIQPYRIEDNARKIAETNFVVKPPFTPYAIKDGNLITGQQQNSGAAAAQLVIEALNE